MSKDYEEEFKGSLEKVLTAAEEISEHLKRYGDSGLKDAKKHQMQFSFMVLRSICKAMQSSKGIHYSIYCDIFQRILSPAIEPTVNIQYWGKYLELIRYFHYLLLDKNLNKEAIIVADYIIKRTNILQNESDYKYILSILYQQLFSHKNYTQINEETTNIEIKKILIAINRIFVKMRQSNRELNFQYSNLIDEFIQCLMPKRRNSNVQYLNSLPQQEITQMYDSFFTLLSEMKICQPKDSELNDICQQHLDAAFVFLQIDVGNKSQAPQQALLLQHMKICRDSKILQADKAIGYILSLFYYYVKLIYTQQQMKNFSQTYIEICEKFIKFFEKNGDTLMNYKWFKDVIVFINLLQAQLHQNATTVFSNFWSQMNKMQPFVTHFNFVLTCIKLAGRLNETKLVSWPCCSNISEHYILACAQIALFAYYIMVQKTDMEPFEETLENGVHKTLYQILSHTINIIDRLPCITVQSNDLKMLMARFSQILRDLKTKTQAKFCSKLTRIFIKIQSKLPAKEWTLLLRRLYKASVLLQDHHLELEFHTFYMASLVKEHDLISLQSQIGYFYSNLKDKEQCLYACYETSTNQLKPQLNDKEKRLLYYMELQNFLFYYKSLKTGLYESLLSYANTNYEYVLLMTTRMNSLNSNEKRLQSLCNEYNKNTAKRLEHLCFGHAMTIRLQNILDGHKKSLTLESKDFAEDNHKSLLERKDLEGVTVANELKLIEMGCQIVEAFQTFYMKMDEEFISSDVAYIDWQRLLDDLIVVSQYFQVAGYINYAAQAWILVYRISTLIDDNMNRIRALCFCCEHCDIIENVDDFNLTMEIDTIMLHVTHYVDNLDSLLARQQTFVLTYLCQLAYNYALSNNVVYSKLLLHLVAMKHASLVKREGKYDLVLGTMHAVQFRILWQQGYPLCTISEGDCADDVEDNSYLYDHCLLREIEATLECFKDFSQISSTDTVPYMILLFSLIAQFTECVANRVCDNIVVGFLACGLRGAFQMGLTLRVIDTLTKWTWSNLQMELIHKAQIKLRMIDVLLGIRTVDELKSSTNSINAIANIPTCSTKKKTQHQRPQYYEDNENINEAFLYAEPISNLFSTLNTNARVETVRKMASSQESPIKIESYDLSPATRERDLKTFLQFNMNQLGKTNDWLQWSYFTAGCLTARLHYLVSDYSQLDEFYERSLKWLDQKMDPTIVCKFQNIKLLNLQHYINYLRAVHKFDKAQKYLTNILNVLTSNQTIRNMDFIYEINFKLQLCAIQEEMQLYGKPISRRVLFASASPVLDKLTIMEPKPLVDSKDELLKTPHAKPRTTVTTTITTTTVPISESVKKLKKMSAKQFTIYNSPKTQAKAETYQPKIEKSKYSPNIDVSDSNSLGDMLNMCQAIDTIDLIDSNDDDGASGSAVTRTAKKTNKKLIKTATISRTPASMPKAANKKGTVIDKTPQLKQSATKSRTLKKTDVDIKISKEATQNVLSSTSKRSTRKKIIDVNVEDNLQTEKLINDMKLLTIDKTDKPKIIKKTISVNDEDDRSSSPSSSSSLSTERVLVAPKVTSSRKKKPIKSNVIVENKIGIDSSQARRRGRSRNLISGNLENMEPAMITEMPSTSRRRLQNL